MSSVQTRVKTPCCDLPNGFRSSAVTHSPPPFQGTCNAMVVGCECSCCKEYSRSATPQFAVCGQTCTGVLEGTIFLRAELAGGYLSEEREDASGVGSQQPLVWYMQ